MTDGGPAPTQPPGTTVAWFHCFSGIAGDMALGSLIDAGADPTEVTQLLGRVPFGGWDLSLETVLRGGIACTRAVVSSSDHVVVRTYRHIVGLVSEARLPPRVTARALEVFAALATTEARLHRRPVDQVHFHEVGGHDTIVDVVGTAAALEVLGVDEVTASPVATGTGTVRAAHGLLPNPSPAVVRLLEGAPTYGRATTVELTTPTGAAILAALATSFGPMPAMDLLASGFGAGRADVADLPNCTQVVLGRCRPGHVGDGQPVTVLEANLDDATGEQLAHTVAALLDAGAHDAWVTPIVMKKGRPGHTVHALCDPVLVPTLRAVLQTGTGTFGVRALSAARWPSSRVTGEVEVAGEPVRVKVGPGRVKAEFDDVSRVSRTTGLALHEVASRAEAAWRARSGAEAPEGSDGPEDLEPA
ncbi:MAG TPA: nickel pincer cofactor biosynthesis protein LarC [Acidimicrobiales bacterium]|nr:nickel pincer cofactor biosynthesis protein LarC [Acidimicrobiales bacterium]